MSEELVEFLRYIEDSTDRTASTVKSEKVKRVHDRVCKVKLNEEVGVRYMQAWEEKYYEREEGKEEGRLERLVVQVCKKCIKGYPVSDIADMLEEDETEIHRIYDVVSRYAPDYDIESIVEELMKMVE